MIFLIISRSFNLEVICEKLMQKSSTIFGQKLKIIANVT